ncbi:MAG: HIRAN domain-containing protein [Lachnospiraceae bacterium]|nr:HIRAN domain-containing protein [Lachnospiraceae bacterium]
MDHEITTRQTGALVQAIDRQGIGEVLKPLIREIHLFDSFVSGTAQLEDPSVLDEIAVDDRLSLLREDSKFDDHAIVLMTGSGRKLGYVPEKDNLVFARLMDAGKLLAAKITGIERRGGFCRIGIGIYLVDF